MNLEALDAPLPRLSHHDQAIALLRSAEAPLSMSGLVHRLGIGPKAGSAVLRDLIDRKAIEPTTIAGRRDIVKLYGEPTPEEMERVGLAIGLVYEAPKRKRHDDRSRVQPEIREAEFAAYLEKRAITPVDLGEYMGLSPSVVSTVLRAITHDGRALFLGKFMHAQAKTAMGMYIGRNLFNKTLKELNS